MVNVYNPVSLTRTHTLWIDCGMFHWGDDPANYGVIATNKARPNALATTCVLYCNIPLPVGAVVNSVTFYGYLGNAASSVQFILTTVRGIDSGENNSQQVPFLLQVTHTATTGLVSSTWSDGDTLDGTTEKTLQAIVSLNADTSTENAKFKGIVVSYTY